jgi:prepilin-type processing-associated H-X9-DG protein
MKLHPFNRRTAAFTLEELLVVIVVLFIVAMVFDWGRPRNDRQRARRIMCISNLKQDGIAYRLWEGDHNDKYPMAVSVTNGGAMELVATGNVAACFRVMSNELSTPKILICPADTRRVWATNFSALTDSNISYFIGLDAAENYPQMLLNGDDNLLVNGERVKAGVLNLGTNIAVAWDKDRHRNNGNLGMADGSAQQVTTPGLNEALIRAGAATNRLAIP